MKLYNTLSGENEEFQSREDGVVKIFVCGPTVYDSTHLGHARTYLVYDVLVRYLKMKGFVTIFIVNITDLDDKVFEKAEMEGINFEDLAERYTQEFITSLERFRINSINAFHKASNYLNEIEYQIDHLIKNGHAYQVDGDIFFDVSSFPDYGLLSNQTPCELMLRRLNPDPKKRDQRDFLLWRSGIGKPQYFKSKFGIGQPGWHIEDTAISLSVFRGGYDIHGGAVDLIFPHHEAEIAQGESFISQHPFVKYWIHTGLLLLEGEKMSKSLGNIISLKDALDQWDPDVLKLCLLSRHYRETFNLRRNDIKDFEGQVTLIRNTVKRLRKRVINSRRDHNNSNVQTRFQNHISNFYGSLENDLDIPKALNALIFLIRAVDKDMVGVNQDLLNELLKMLAILGLEA
ncbi:MAG: cysteine--tRNA ligase [Nitrososphaerales archaeon]|nr:cysteine--tRNA ligase [Nitrososphaerales archaeon]